MADVTKPITLADLERGGKLAWVYCNGCGRDSGRPWATHGDAPAPQADTRPD